MLTLGVGNGLAPGSQYVGPGDVVASAVSWWGLRAYSRTAALAGANAVTLCTALDAACETEVVNAHGTLSLGAVGATCNASTVICTAKELFDQTGNGNDAAQATIALRPTFNPNCTGFSVGRPCLVWTGAGGHQGLFTSATMPLGLAQPVTLSWVIKRSGDFGIESTVFSSFNGTTQISDFFGPGANSLGTFAGTGQSITAADAAFHAEQSVYNGASSIMYLDGSSHSVNPSTGGLNAARLFAIGNQVTTNDGCACTFAEGGVWGSAFTAPQQATMNSNQHVYWGF